MKLAVKFFVLAFVLALFSYTQADAGVASADSQTASAVVTAVKTAVAAIDTPVKIADSSITADTLINNATSVVSAVKGLKAGTITLLLVIAAIIKLLLSIMKFPMVAGLLDTPKVKPIKPYIALAIGILGGFLASLTTGQSLLISALAGLTAGFGSIGIHETWKSIRKKNG